MFDLAISTTIKDENRYLPEWIAYHASLGVDHFFIFDNGSKEPIASALEPETRQGLATVVEFPGRFVQMPAIRASLERFCPLTRWMAFIDLDEFIVPKRHDNLKALLADFTGFGGLGVNWQWFGSSGRAVRPEGLQIEGFLMRADVRFREHNTIKTIVRTDAIQGMASPHHAVYRPGQTCVNEAFRPIPGPTSPVSVDVVQLNHYYTRSRAEFAEKESRGNVSYDRTPPVPYAFDGIDPNLNSVKDESILRFVPGLRARLRA